jgi:hypothetical protein
MHLEEVCWGEKKSVIEGRRKGPLPRGFPIWIPEVFLMFISLHTAEL